MSPRTARVRAQAKVNLRLRVLAREAGGHHQLETLFLRLTMGDDIVVRVGVSGQHLDCRGADCGPVERNLAWRAAMAMEEAGAVSGFAIEIDKRIPVGGGLGGGSADAAAVLRALNALAERPLPDETLLALAASLGADVPFLVSPATMALAWGRGERLLRLHPPPPRPVVLALPPFGVPTGEAYAWVSESAALPVVEPALHDPATLGSWDRIAALATNDFEEPVSERFPAIARLVRTFRLRGAAIAMMSGSGSTVFGVFDRPLEPLAPLPDGTRFLATETAVRVEEVSGEA